MRLTLVAGLLAAAAAFHGDAQLKRQLREVAGELRELDDAPPARASAQATSRRKIS